MKFLRKPDAFWESLPAQNEPPQSEALRKMVDGLPQPERHVIERIFFGGASYAEIGAELNLSAAKVKYVKLKALKRLQGKVLKSDEVREMFPEAMPD